MRKNPRFCAPWLISSILTFAAGRSAGSVAGPKIACSKVFAPKINFSSAETYSESGLALGRDGTLWAWGNNSYGQLGNFDVLPSGNSYPEDSAQVGVSGANGRRSGLGPWQMALGSCRRGTGAGSEND